ncbi:MAG: hypothetical protein HY064_09650 [Bacteroidetes bacterium]|nr:hypothetical protein [Bacteroidota bacterium]
MKNKFLQICIGITLVLFGAGFLIRSVSTADAAPRPENFIDEGSSQIGKYTVTMSEDANTMHCIILNTADGSSKYYYFGGSGEWMLSEHQLPQ